MQWKPLNFIIDGFYMHLSHELILGLLLMTQCFAFNWTQVSIIFLSFFHNLFFYVLPDQIDKKIFLLNGFPFDLFFVALCFTFLSVSSSKADEILKNNDGDTLLRFICFDNYWALTRSLRICCQYAQPNELKKLIRRMLIVALLELKQPKISFVIKLETFCEFLIKTRALQMRILSHVSSTPNGCFSNLYFNASQASQRETFWFSSTI